MIYLAEDRAEVFLLIQAQYLYLMTSTAKGLSGGRHAGVVK